MIDLILADNSRPACGGAKLIRYSAGGVFLALAKKRLDVRWVDLMSDVPGNVSSKPAGNLADICCYAVFFGNKVNAFRHMEYVRQSKTTPHLIIAFGPFASIFPEEILSRGLADIVVVSDPEFVVPQALQKGDDSAYWKNIPNLVYRHKGKVTYTRKYSFQDLDEIPYISPYLYSLGHRPAFLMTARGCQHHCVFCDRNVLWGGGVRHRSINNVLNEISELVEVRHIQSIQFLDEDIAADHKRLVAICEGMRRIKGEFYWECASGIDSVNRKILLLMGRSRCRQINFGMESASSRVLRGLGKTYGDQEILNAVSWAQEAMLKVEVMVTIGNPRETDFDKNFTLSVLHKMGPEVSVRANRLVILPGTALYRKGLQAGWFTQASFFEDEGINFFDEIRQG